MTTNTQTQHTTLLQVVERVLIAVAVAASIGGGSAILTNWNTNAIQEQQLNTISLRLSSTDILTAELKETQRQLAVLSERISWLITK